MYIHSTSKPNRTSISCMASNGVATLELLAPKPNTNERIRLVAIISVTEHEDLLPIHIMQWHLDHHHPNAPRYCQLHVNADALTIYIPHDSVFKIGQTKHTTPTLTTLCWADPHTDEEDFHISIATLVFTGENEVTL